MDMMDMTDMMAWREVAGVYRTMRDYYAAVVKEWLSYGGQNSRQFIRETFARETDQELADKVIAARFALEREFGLVQAITDYRQIVGAWPVEDDEASNLTLW